jgi:3'-phosphoadenosine 5'-phosphosulfate sulfotransferase (PAPS reductase)/FAD synthetase
MSDENERLIAQHNAEMIDAAAETFTPHWGSRTVVWFSAGAASAVAAKLTLNEGPAVLVYTDPGSEHPDNQRFIRDCKAWFGQEVVQLRSEKYRDTWQVWEERRFLVGPTGALCTVELKKRQRFAFQRPDDVQVFGYTAEESHRAERFREQNPGVDLRTPLIERGLTKADCLAMVDRAGIELPAMYQLGFRNANCIGCPKGGKGYWNRIRREFPDVFARMCKLEHTIGASIFRGETGPEWLDTLHPKSGSDQEPDIECSLLCVLAEGDL